MDIEKAISVLKEKKRVTDVDVWLEAFDMVVRSIEDKLHEDLILVVRCKDCKHSKRVLGGNKLYCLREFVSDDHYCGYGVQENQNN